MMNRYAGKPFLRLLECFVLNAIGNLEERHAEILRLMEPKLEATYGMKGTWLEIIQAQMEFPDSFVLQVRDLWKRNLEMAQARGETINPEQFAAAFVDENFSEQGQPKQ